MKCNTTKENATFCADGKKTFSFSNDLIWAAGEKTNYYLRPVKTVCIKLK